MRSKRTQLVHLKLEKVENMSYKFGAENPFTSEFFYLNPIKDDASDFHIKSESDYQKDRQMEMDH